jgi:hypothetical protein
MEIKDVRPRTALARQTRPGTLPASIAPNRRFSEGLASPMTMPIPERHQHLGRFAFNDNPALADRLLELLYTERCRRAMSEVGQEASQIASAADRQKYHRARGQDGASTRSRLAIRNGVLIG